MQRYLAHTLAMSHGHEIYILVSHGHEIYILVSPQVAPRPNIHTLHGHSAGTDRFPDVALHRGPL
jgi:hypothetical protein